MKKKIVLTLCALFAVVLLFATLTACNVTSGDANVSDDYSQEQVDANLEQMRADKGYKLTYGVDASGNGENESETFAFGAKGDVYYVLTPDGEAYYDLSAEESAAYYVKGNGVWTKTVKTYGENWTKADAKAEVTVELSAASAYSRYYFSSESGVTAGSGMQKDSGKVLGRDCDTYTFGVKVLVVSFNSTIYVDKATGVCLKWAVDGSVAGQGGGITFECREFDTNPTFTLPEVSEENTTYEEGGNGNGAEEGNEESGVSVVPEIANAVSKANELRLSTGFNVTYRTMVAGEASSTVTIAARGDVYYYDNGANVYYYDLTEDATYDVYTKQDGDTWTKETCAYEGEDETKASVTASVMSNVAELTLSADVTSKRMIKTDDTFLGRPAYKYSETEVAELATSTEVVYVDKATGMLLKHEVSITSTLTGTQRVGIECTAFSTEFSVDLSTLTLAEEE